MKNLPYYAWHTDAVRKCETYQAMSYEERGVYRDLLDNAWDHDGLDPDLEFLALTLKLPFERFQQMWKLIGRKFTLAPDGRLRNNRQEKERSIACEKSANARKAVASREANKRLSVDDRSIISGSSEDHVRASESLSCSSGVLVSPEESARGTTSLNRPAAIRADGCWDEFESAATEAGMGASSEEWIEMSSVMWPRLDFEAKLAAVQTIRRRVASGEYGGDKFTPLARSYLEKKLWTRPDRKQPKTQLSASLKALEEA